ncbi:hypothetical protein M9434_000733 [Picochlorum sp. BPE23]|jgi:hypothetical protein|uniref:CHCH domain-containing protein n=1 Tax=Picochlorum oklahomense TaxID=249345 RepID=A0A7S1GHD8_9CHLO|nr:hypothetical protein M9434_000733 [Picochlorum sp. BPE23]|mmetsp:Transcript_1835/g.3773  ORF Transcript_1835/g.3773 Transcript_1835/m.3773 type:complete len:136 (+) Transcript_1835:47-454(+)|eukprot:CAMPEP_0118798774 /NCGR_PEP_ID=MMETSP1161-20130426/1134_1 /TAXON_ID=249345 /ORGANISM="Picochlorum oklahomensis, Strain CCMP2329" /LENGTH=135 /DNA_ID=CAMNT_0006726319 /DNA_START=47 /DNA_END=454 /DNA_ORIENTATION=-
MGRRRSASPRGGSGRRFSTSASAPPPQRTKAAPPPAPQQATSSSPGLMGTVMQGMAFGGGSAMAHRAVDAVLGPRYGPVQPVEAQQAAETIVQENMECGEQAKAFSDCMSLSGGDMDACRVFFERMQECRIALSQ